VTDKPRRSLPSWMPNPIDSFGLFGVEALTVIVLASVSVGVATVALWLF
jgi:hypothetical protein